MSARIEWAQARTSAPMVLGRDDDWVGADDLEPGERALTFDTGGNVVALYGSDEDLDRIADVIRDTVPRVIDRMVDAREGDANDLGDGKHGVLFANHYIEHTVTAEGVVVDVYDCTGQDHVATSVMTWEEVLYATVRS